MRKSPAIFDGNTGTIQVPLASRVRSLSVVDVDGKEYVQIQLEEKPVEHKILATVAVERG